MSPPSVPMRPDDFGIGTLFWRLSDALFVTDMTTDRIVLWNPAAETVFGYAPPEILGRSVATLFPEASKPFPTLGRVIGLAARHKDGRPLWVEVSLSPIDHQPDPGRYQLAIARDVSDRYKDEFLAALSHELRTPITSIVGFTELLEDEVVGALNTEQRDVVAGIDKATRGLLALIEDMLDLARWQAGALHLDRRTADLGLAVRDVVASLAPLAEAGDIALCVEVPVQPIWGDFDERQIRRAVFKLVDNAIRFTRAGGKVSVKATALAGGLAVEVADTGIGIADADLPRLFERFWQSDMSSTRAAGGMGLGLPLAQAIVEGHGGKLEVNSRLGEGSTFRAVIPVATGG